MWSSTYASGQDAARDTRAAPGAAPLLVAEDDDDETGLAERLDRLEPGEDAERPVEAARARDGVQMRARPDLTLAARNPPDQVPRSVDLHLEPGLAEPPSRQLVRRVLLGGVADPVPQSGELVESLEDPHAGLAAFGAGNVRSTSHPAIGNNAASP